METKEKIPPERKIKQVKRYLEGRISQHGAARECGVSPRTFEIWVAKYKAEGSCGLFVQRKYKRYPKSVKEAAVQEYLKGGCSLVSLCEKYAISSPHPLRNWIQGYNAHGKVESSSGGRSMGKTRKTTREERLEIVRYCILHRRNYGEAANRYSVSYQSVYRWVQKYENLGIAGLEDRRGRKRGTGGPRTPEEELKAKIADLEAQNRDLRMENDLLKKVDELLREKRFR